MLSTSQIIYTYLLTVPVFFLIDLLWLGVIGRPLYDKYIGSFLAKNPNWTAAGIFYLFYIFGIIYFAVLPAIEDASVIRALINGALFGALAYGTYELTNLAVLKNWPTQIVYIDMVWGIVLTSSVATLSYYIAQWVS